MTRKNSRPTEQSRGLLPQRIPLSPSAMAEDNPKQKCALLMMKLQSPLPNFI